MKNFILIAFMFVSLMTSGQTAYTATHIQKKSSASELSVASFRNPYIGAKLVRNISGDVSDFFQLSGRFIYTPVGDDNWGFPIMGNVALNQIDSFSLDNGVILGAYPWKKLIDGDLTLIAHGAVAYQMPPKQDLSHQDRFTAILGLEVALNGQDGGPPTTLSVAPTWIFESGENPRNAFGLEMTGVVPIANSFALLVEGTIPFKSSDLVQKGVQAGVIIYSFVK